MDLTKLLLHSSYPAFKNNNVFTDSFNISGTITGGVNTRSVTLDLGFTPDIADIVIGEGGEYSKEIGDSFYGASRLISIPGTGTVTPGTIDTPWAIGTRISGSSLVVTAYNIHQVDETVTLTSTPITIRVIDYSSIGVSDKIAFDSRFNYMKRGLESKGLVGSIPLTLPSAGDTVTHTIEHNLGYIPFFIVGGNTEDTSIIWSNNPVWSNTSSISFSSSGPVQLWHRCNTSRLEINLVNGAETGSRTVWWAIYLDYS
jgi:hypothetical protein